MARRMDVVTRFFAEIPSIYGWSFSFMATHAMVVFGIAFLSVLSRILVILFGKHISTGFLVLLEMIAYFSFYALIVAIFSGGTPAGGVLGAYRDGLFLLISPVQWVRIASAGFQFLTSHWLEATIHVALFVVIVMIVNGLVNFFTGNRYSLRMARAASDMRAEDVPAVEFVRTVFWGLFMIPFTMIFLYALYRLL
jgi:hypothetical protein